MMAGDPKAVNARSEQIFQCKTGFGQKLLKQTQSQELVGALFSSSLQPMGTTPMVGEALLCHPLCYLCSQNHRMVKVGRGI